MIAAATGMVLLLTACLPDDEILKLEFSPDGRMLGIVYADKGLAVANLETLEKRVLAAVPVDSEAIAWTTSSRAILYASTAEGSMDVYSAALDGTIHRLTASPSRELHPMVREDVAWFLSTETGESRFTTASLREGAPAAPGSKLEFDGGVSAPAMAPDGRHIAWFSVEDLCLQVFLGNIETGQVDQLTSETDPLGLVEASLWWYDDSRSVGLMRSPVEETGSRKSLFHDAAPEAEPRSPGADLYRISIDPPGEEQLVLHSDSGMANVSALPGEKITFEENGKVCTSDGSGGRKQLLLDFPAGQPAVRRGKEEIAFVAARQLVGLTSGSLAGAPILAFDIQEKFLLAEEYFRAGNKARSLEIYEELAASVQRTRDPELAKFVYIANLRRLGQNAKAVQELEQFLLDNPNSIQVPGRLPWRMLAFSYLLELDNLDKARQSFQRCAELTTQTAESIQPDSASNALEILNLKDDALARLYGQAVKARLNGDFARTDTLFGELLTSAPHVGAVQREYASALEGFDQEVYFFSPTQRPFTPTRFQQAEYLERLVTLAPESDSAREARLNLFLLRIEMGSYSRARALLKDALTSVTADSRPDGILEVFRNYLETPEPQPWINQSIPEVFLHGEIRPQLEAVATEPYEKFLVYLAATKMALLNNEPDRARQEADSALTEWNRIAPEEIGADELALYGRLLVLRAREAELRGLYSEAVEAYRSALKSLEEKRADNFEFQEEIRYRAELLSFLLVEKGDALSSLKQMEARAGMELVNPGWEREALSAVIQDNVRMYRRTTSTLRLWHGYEAGVSFGKLKRDAQARAAFVRASAPDAPEFLMRKATFELAALDELEGDAWNAARHYARLAAMPSSTLDVKMWCSYQIARLHLSINYKPSSAREALALIVSNRPETPLAIQAQELLLSTSTR